MSKTNFFLDTEFIEDAANESISLISVGIVSEDDSRKYYACNRDCDFSKADSWIQENVISKLPREDSPEWKPKKEIASEIISFINDDDADFWAYFADYDWVVFCWIFGRMIDLPKNFPMYCKDLKQEADRIGLRDEDYPETSQEHNALHDAMWNRRLFEKIFGEFEKI